MPCFPGFTPVANDVQATQEKSGTVVCICARVPRCAMRPRFGMVPSSMRRRASVWGRPSIPRMNAGRIRISAGARLLHRNPQLHEPRAGLRNTAPENDEFIRGVAGGDVSTFGVVWHTKEGLLAQLARRAYVGDCKLRG